MPHCIINLQCHEKLHCKEAVASEGCPAALDTQSLPCLVVYVKFQFVYTTKSKMGSQLLLASTSSHVQL